MAADEREAYVKKMADRRAELQAEIGKLAQERDAYIAGEQKRLTGETSSATLGDAVVAAIGKQLSDAGFEQSDRAK
jgi:hypothetical protein